MLMNRLDDYMRFSKVIARYDEFCAKHIINLLNYEDDIEKVNYLNKNQKPVKVQGAIREYKTECVALHNLKTTLQITTEDMILLTRSSKPLPGQTKPNNAYFALTPAIFDRFALLLDIGLEWLEPDNDEIFQRDVNGKFIGIKEDKKGISGLVRNMTRWVMIKPAAIFMNNNEGEPCVHLKCDRGPLHTFKKMEFESFCKVMKGLMNNFYGDSLALYNAGLLSVLYSGVKNASKT